MSIRTERADGKINTSALIYNFVPKFDPDGTIKETKAAERGIPVYKLEQEWRDESTRATVKGNAVATYLKKAINRIKGEEDCNYIGSRLPEFDQIEDFLTQYEIISRETEVSNDVVFGRADLVVKHKETGEEFIVEEKSGNLGDVSYEPLGKPFEDYGSSKLEIARLQAAMYTLMSKEVKKGLVVHIGPNIWTAHEVLSSDYKLAEGMFTYRREMLKKEGRA